MPKDLRKLPQKAREYVELRADMHAQLSRAEEQWVPRQVLLRERGYVLRPRYREGWKPSWSLPANRDINPESFEDYIVLPPRGGLIDATRSSDGRLVCIKAVLASGNESQIVKHFSEPPLANDPRNHCVPILDTVDDNDLSYLVMPFLHPVDDPPFETVANVVDFVDQILEGLVFIHEHGVAHRDCTTVNLMMDATSLYPEGFHPVNKDVDPSAQRNIVRLPRANTKLRYYFIDFGISVRIPLDQSPKVATGAFGIDRDVPELSFDKPYDPFKVDVCITGNMFRHLFHDKYTNVSFLLPLIEAMTREDPVQRLSAIAAQAQWFDIRKSISALQQAWRVRPSDEFLPEALVRDGLSLFRVGRHFFGWVADFQG